MNDFIHNVLEHQQRRGPGFFYRTMAKEDFFLTTTREDSFFYGTMANMRKEPFVGTDSRTDGIAEAFHFSSFTPHTFLVLAFCANAAKSMHKVQRGNEFSPTRRLEMRGRSGPIVCPRIQTTQKKPKNLIFKFLTFVVVLFHFHLCVRRRSRTSERRLRAILCQPGEDSTRLPEPYRSQSKGTCPAKPHVTLSRMSASRNLGSDVRNTGMFLFRTSRFSVLLDVPMVLASALQKFM
ncbi:hypothetical protein BaRGS_00002125 [Batillaria attramentaria]|uniref:Uncharacterized protein n=1 Tax=Batillaria attramentaria TaxID=370345 RepID=A0ABD0M4Q6_9CAEN